MRRTARALSVAALTGVALGAPAAAASADPAAEVSPGTVAPGGSVTVSVTCDALDGSAPTTLQATSQAFEEGTVELKRVSGTDGKAAGPAYRGGARVPPAESFEGDPDAAGAESDWTVDGTCPAAGGGEGKEWSATFTVARESGGGSESGVTDSGVSGLSVSDSGGGKGSDAGGKGRLDGAKGEGSGGRQGGSGVGGTDGGGHTCKDPESDWTGAGRAEPYAAESEAGKAEPGWDGADTGGTGGLDGTDAGGLGGDGLGTGGTDTGGTGAGESDAEGTDASGIAPEWDTGTGKKEPGAEDCGGATDQHGVRAGTGGTFTDSVPALVAGGVLIAGAFGGAAYRLRRRTTTPQD
ncbi:hypothetical protein [Streptomyces sp. bgisy027]|uniref:hypothetical protein n=1 Tax=Streptomyces sp. bgisy027 TaxID=3413770 RepID=UPI003D708AFE